MRASRLFTLAVLVPTTAFAEGKAGLDPVKETAAVQAEGVEAPARVGEPVDGNPGEVRVPADAADSAPPEAAEGRADAAPISGETAYTVKQGDTLWDLSSRFLATPWAWPKLWSYNPKIANPHYIYPGDVVRVRGDGQDGPAPVVADSAEAEPDSPKELDDLSRADMKKPQEFGDGDEVEVVGPYKIGYVAPKGVFARRDSFVTKRELQESGTISAAFEDKLLLSIHDRAYVRFADPSKVKPGETYVIYKTERPIRHPVTGELFGYQTTIIGAGKVVAVDDKAVSVDVAQAYEPIERGALVGLKAQKLAKQIVTRPNGKALDGFIIASRRDDVSELGEHHVVFVDKGRADGVEEGNVFTVVRSGDPYGGNMREPLRDPRFPKEDVGSLLVVDAQQSASAALVVRSARELFVGDKVEMRVAAAEGSRAPGAAASSR